MLNAVTKALKIKNKFVRNRVRKSNKKTEKRGCKKTALKEKGLQTYPKG